MAVANWIEIGRHGQRVIFQARMEQPDNKVITVFCGGELRDGEPVPLSYLGFQSEREARSWLAGLSGGAGAPN